MILNMMRHDMIYCIVFVLLFITELLYFKIADKYNIIDKPNLRSSHTRVVLRGGGILFLLGAWVDVLFWGMRYPWFMIGLTAIAGISFVDDMRAVPNKIRLAVHFISMFFLFQEFGILALDWWWMVILVLIICVGIINAYNFMDGINGITGGYSLAVLIPLWYLNRSMHFVDEHVILVTIISVGVFCFFNFRTKAKCFAGDVGSVGIAFIILFLLGKLILFTENPVYILFLVVYGIDSVLTIIHRILLHENLGEAHRKHVYQLMANELKIPHVAVALIYMFLQVTISFGLVYVQNICQWIYFVAIVFLLSSSYVIFVKKYYHLHAEYLKNRMKNINV